MFQNITPKSIVVIVKLAVDTPFQMKTQVTSTTFRTIKLIVLVCGLREGNKLKLSSQSFPAPGVTSFFRPRKVICLCAHAQYRPLLTDFHVISTIFKARWVIVIINFYCICADVREVILHTYKIRLGYHKPSQYPGEDMF